jgi:hypothetical protein
MFSFIYAIFQGIFWSRSIRNAAAGRPGALIAKVAMPPLRRAAQRERRPPRR